MVYGYFPAVSEGDDVIVLTEPRPDAAERFRFTFPRQQRDRFLCIADFIRSRELAAERGQVDVLPFQLVTMGQPIADFANELFASDSYRDYLEVHGIGVQLTEALAEYWHKRVREELKFADHAMAAEDPDAVEDYFKLGYRGARFSFGYGACPNLDDRAKMVELLEPERIGVTLSEELQLHPEQSTDAFVLHHPEAKYFNTTVSRNSSAFARGPLRHRGGRGTGEFVTRSLASCGMTDAVVELVEIPRRRSRPRAGWNAASASALPHCSIADRHADADPDLLSDLRAGQRLGTGDSDTSGRSATHRA